MKIEIETIGKKQTVIVNGLDFKTLDKRFQWKTIQSIMNEDNLQELFLHAIQPEDFIAERELMPNDNIKTILCQK